jgi:hypothetical protein
MRYVLVNKQSDHPCSSDILCLTGRSFENQVQHSHRHSHEAVCTAAEQGCRSKQSTGNAIVCYWVVASQVKLRQLLVMDEADKLLETGANGKEMCTSFLAQVKTESPRKQPIFNTCDMLNAWSVSFSYLTP